MAIGTLGAIALGGSLIGGIASSSSNASAARRATDASMQATQENNALARDIFSQNQQTLRPFVQQGGAATSFINQLLGLPNAPQQAQTLPMMGGMDNAGQMPNFGGGFLGALREGAWRQSNPQGTVTTPTMPTAQPTAAPGAAQAGFDAFRNSTGYNFRLGEGQRAITNNAALRGMLNSGSTLKALTRFGQDIGSQEFGNFLNTLLGQQSLGLNAASAQAGVANNFSSQVQANNAANASNIGNAALARAGANNQFLSSLLGAGGYALGGRG